MDLFSNAHFIVSIEPDELDDIISKENIIIIKVPVYCCDIHTPTRLYTIKNMVMTQKNVICELILQGLTRTCDHVFLVKIHKITECYFELWFDS
jgi:hypothetical protein